MARLLILNVVGHASMEKVDQILKEFILTPEQTGQLADRVKESAIDCGKKGSHKQLSTEDFNLLDDISDKVWYSTLELSTKIEIGFGLFELFPSYYHFLVPFYHELRDNNLANEQESKIWSKFMDYLSSDPYYADPTGYVLWVDFFEDPDTVTKSWNGLASQTKNKIALSKLLESAGPVPFELKEPLYNSLMGNTKYHESIFKSLLFSATDVYGQLDKRRAGQLLGKLKVDKRTDNYRTLQERLK